MFTNPGAKIKLFSMVGFWVTSIACIISAAVYASENDANLIFWLLLLIGPLASYISTLFLVGFGELVENSGLGKSDDSATSDQHDELPEL